MFCGHLADLPHHLLRRLVLAHALERRLANQPVAGPAAEFDLDDDLRLDPFHLAPALHRRHRIERRCLARDRGEALRQVALLPLAPAGADAPGVAQFAILVIAEQERANRARRFVGGLIADDDELLARSSTWS